MVSEGMDYERIPAALRRFLVVLPTYNEVGNVRSLIDRLLTVDERIDILVVDDNSPDGTSAVVRDIAIDSKRVSLFSRPSKLGLGSAYLVGITHALKHEYAAVVTMDADHSHDPRHLPAMFDALDESEVVVGSRYTVGGTVENWSVVRKINSMVANALARFCTGVIVSDYTSGFRVYRSELLLRMDRVALQAKGYSLLVELLSASSDAGAKIVEVPICFRNREAGMSKISFREVLLSILTCFRILGRRIRRGVASRSRLASASN